ncbi:MAG: sigma-70 family RNA polymerase sigma factor [Planctomycetales bacterium]|nr:sigma-70 family RNA polymerase sigma factor [Planctomycetales bacterium]
MIDNETAKFEQFLAKIRAGDEPAAAHLVSEFESLVRREVRMRLLDPRLRRVLDSGDVCQSVLASFFVRAAAGQFDLENPHALLKLLVSMARKKSAEAARRHYQQRRDVRRHSAPAEFDQPDGQLETPSQMVACQEILDRVNELLSPQEKQILDMRREGGSWQEIANRLGGTADGRRVQVARLMDRVCCSLGLDPKHVGRN